MLHIPILRRGVPYRSLDVARAPHHRTRAHVAEVSQANVGLIRRDLLDQERGRRALEAFTTEELIRISARASEIFMSDELPIGDDGQTPELYVEQLSATTGMPHVMVRRNMEKVRGVLAEMRTVLAGLTRNLDLTILDRGFGEIEGRPVSFFPRTQSLGVVLPSNSPGVHTLWVPSVALKTPLVLKPGGAEPWTPYRIIQAFIKAGAPPEAFSFYPTDHAGAAEILRRTGRGMVFGDSSSTSQWEGDGRVEVHGPGHSKLVFGADCAGEWREHLDVLVTSVLENGGRSCVNASGVWTPAHAEEIAGALADRLASVRPRAADDPEAQLAPFADPAVAARVSAMIDAGLREPGARDLTAERRGGPRLVEWEGSTYLLPTVLLCESAAHPLADREFMFPFAAVVRAEAEEIPAALGPSLVITAITRDRELVRRLLQSPNVDRLNLGGVPTNRLGWDQPHEGNLFEHLYARRAFQSAAAFA
jgi:Aldehyde dehydrogenase family